MKEHMNRNQMIEYGNNMLTQGNVTAAQKAYTTLQTMTTGQEEAPVKELGDAVYKAQIKPHLEKARKEVQNGNHWGAIPHLWEVERVAKVLGKELSSTYMEIAKPAYAGQVKETLQDIVGFEAQGKPEVVVRARKETKAIADKYGIDMSALEKEVVAVMNYNAA